MASFVPVDLLIGSRVISYYVHSAQVLCHMFKYLDSSSDNTKDLSLFHLFSIVIQSRKQRNFFFQEYFLNKGGRARQSFCEAKMLKGCRSSKFQLMTLTHNSFVLRTTHQPAKPVETNNTSHVFAAETIKAKLLNINNLLMWKLEKTRQVQKTKFGFGFGHPKKGKNMSLPLQVGGEFVGKTPVTHLSHYERCYCKNLLLASSRSDSFENSNISCNPLQISH